MANESGDAAYEKLKQEVTALQQEYEESEMQRRECAQRLAEYRGQPYERSAGTWQEYWELSKRVHENASKLHQKRSELMHQTDERYSLRQGIHSLHVKQEHHQFEQLLEAQRRTNEQYTKMEERAERTDMRLSHLEIHADQVDDNITAVRRELASHAAHTNQRFDQMQQQMDQRFDQMQQQMNQRFTRLETKIDQLIDYVRVRFDDHERRLTRLENPA
jgi:hypothetical protein